ncbi:MAG: CopG family transcriptional regulator [Verrucomicrobiae bacterium]|nr:CopG family transcriptional regulator [Verrucomicrobiae bacterium]
MRATSQEPQKGRVKLTGSLKLRLPDDDLGALQAIAARRRSNVSNLVREAVATFLERNAQSAEGTTP